MKKILFIAGAKPNYPRNSNNLKLLRQNFEVKEITCSANSYIKRFLNVGFRFIFSKKDADAIYIGFMGHPLVILAKIFSRKPIIFDVFISLYDSICFDRKIFKPNSLIGKIAYFLDKTSCAWADTIITDTQAHADWFAKTFNLPPAKFKSFYICADPTLFKPLQKPHDNKFIIEFHGGFIPLQGVDTIIRAAKILENQADIIFNILGKGPTLDSVKKLAEELKIKNIVFYDKFIPIEELPAFINQGDLALGIFGTVDKTFRVIPNKAFEAVACGKPLITCDSEAIREVFKDGESLILCRAGDPQDLADKILKLKNDPGLRQKIAENGHEAFNKVCNFNSLKNQLAEIISNTIIKI
ncbi:MAG: glycosyltransferase family 4 protein [Candidatus Pacebacteria bacterium]|nr:glycosyltransferase family 4 protein [Candidatus Paceibacterota bacterium]